MTRRPHLVIARDAIDAAQTLADASPMREVGGVLFGFRNGRDVHVEDIIQVFDPTATGTRFVLRAGPRDEAIRVYRATLATNSIVGYVGTWHSHPADADPSGTDRRTFQRELHAARDRLAMLVVVATATGWEPRVLIGQPRLIGRRAHVTVV